MNKQEAICELGSLIGYFQTQYSIKEADGKLEDGEAKAYAKKFEALHQGMTTLEQSTDIVNCDECKYKGDCLRTVKAVFYPPDSDRALNYGIGQLRFCSRGEISYKKED